MADKLRLLIIGAHPDDADYSAGGLAALYRGAGHTVKMISMTNGDAGHHQLKGPELAKIRKAEARASGESIGADYDVFDNHDGQLLPTLEVRAQVIRLIRSYQPDLVLTHRPNDYHPDHRYTSQVVQDAAYMVTVPAVVPEVPHLRQDPVICYMYDDFQKPYAFAPDVIVDVGPVLDKIAGMLHCHKSQFYEWLAYNHQYEAEVPKEDAARLEFMKKKTRERIRPRAGRFQDLLVKTYGPARAAAIEYVEAFEPCEYGAP
ncbi:MAG: PIG-L deacetylase family protein, partial [Gemmataceae bacterium]